MDILLLIILFSLLVIFKLLKLGDYFSPWGITAVIWFAILLLYQFQGNLLEPITDSFYYCLSLWIPIFCASSIITYLSLPKVDNPEEASISELHINEGVFQFLYVIAMVLTPVYVYQILKLAASFDLSDIFYNLRLLAVYGDSDYGILRYSYVINQALFIIAIWRYPKIPTWQLVTIILANLIGELAIMEKSGIFFMIINALFVLFEKNVIKTRTIAFTIIGAVALFMLFNTLMTDTSQDSQFGSFTVADFLAIYILSPAVAFGRVTKDITDQFGPHCFQVIYLLTNRLGLTNVEVNQRLQEFVWVPLPTNVYTIFRLFYQDFGYKGVAFFAFLYGTLSGWVYRLYRNGSSIGRCIYCYVIFVLIMQFYQENLLLSFFVFLQLTFFLIIMTENKLSLSFTRFRKAPLTPKSN